MTWSIVLQILGILVVLVLAVVGYQIFADLRAKRRRERMPGNTLYENYEGDSGSSIALPTDPASTAFGKSTVNNEKLNPEPEYYVFEGEKVKTT